MRLRKAIEVLRGKNDLYGLEWGDPEIAPPLKYVRDHFLKPYLSPLATVVEVGPGGGRWTRYMQNVKKIYAVDYYTELLNELESNLGFNNIVYIKNNGDDFPNIQNSSIDYLFSFGTFVHLDIEIIDLYLRNMKPLLKPSANVVIQYSDKTKPLAKTVDSFSENNPLIMRELVTSHDYSIYEEDLKTLWHSSIVRFGVKKAST